MSELWKKFPTGPGANADTYVEVKPVSVQSHLNPNGWEIVIYYLDERDLRFLIARTAQHTEIIKEWLCSWYSARLDYPPFPNPHPEEIAELRFNPHMAQFQLKVARGHYLLATEAQLRAADYGIDTESVHLYPKEYPHGDP